jgi:cell division protein ZapA (FtsZ GTPase activity inhibitor)
MDSSQNKLKNVANNMIKSVSQLKESSFVLLITVITLIIILIALLYYFYYSSLKSRNCKTMNAVYGDLNGKIRSIDNSDQFNYTFKDYYIKSAYNCCSGGNYKNDYVDLCSMKDLLKQGVRGLDFEIFSISSFVLFLPVRFGGFSPPSEILVNLQPINL